MPQEMRVGQLAKRTGLSVRTLHYYDEIGLLEPSNHSAAGHRLYTASDVARLQQIVSLRQLGFSLDEIRDCLQQPNYAPLPTIELHLGRLEEQIEVGRRLHQRLRSIAARLRSAEEVSVEQLLTTIEETTMLEKYYSEEQMKQLAERRESVGEKRMAQSQTEWQEIYDGLRAEMDRGSDPASPEVQAWLAKSDSLIAEFTGGDAGIAASLQKLHQDQPDLPQKYGMNVDAELRGFMARARAAKS